MEYLALTKTGGFFLFAWIVEIMGYIMSALFKFTSLFGVQNIGLSIILFTLVVKVLMFPLTIKQQKASKLMAVMQPEIQAIQNKYKGKTDNDSMMKMNVETKAVYEKYGTSMTGGCLQLVIQLPILLALYRVIYNIPAYVGSVKTHFMNIVFALTGAASATDLADGAGASLLQFATEHGVNLKGMNAIGDLTGVTGTALGNKMVDILYKMNPSQWGDLAGAFPNAADVIHENYKVIEGMNSFLGINLAAQPFDGSFVPNLAWLIPILAGLSQYLSTKLMMNTNPSSAGDENQAAQMMNLCDGNLELYSGNDDQVVPLLSIGGLGVISVLSNIAPRQAHNIVMEFLEGDYKKAAKLQLDAIPLINALFSEVNPIPVKAAMNMLGMQAGPLRAPLSELEDAHKEILRQEMIKYGLMK